MRLRGGLLTFSLENKTMVRTPVQDTKSYIPFCSDADLVVDVISDLPS